MIRYLDIAVRFGETVGVELPTKSSTVQLLMKIPIYKFGRC